MQDPEALLAIAQIALGLAGFGGLFVAVGRGARSERGPADTYRLVMLLSTALTTLCLSLVPVGLRAIGVADAAVWRASSALMIALIGSVMALVIRDNRRHREEIRAGEVRSAAAAIWLLAFATLAAQLANAAGLFGERSYGVFLLGLIFLVAFGSYLFARMLFLWRS